MNPVDTVDKLDTVDDELHWKDSVRISYPSSSWHPCSGDSMAEGGVSVASAPLGASVVGSRPWHGAAVEWSMVSDAAVWMLPTHLSPKAPTWRRVGSEVRPCLLELAPRGSNHCFTGHGKDAQAVSNSMSSHEYV